MRFITLECISSSEMLRLARCRGSSWFANEEARGEAVAAAARTRVKRRNMLSVFKVSKFDILECSLMIARAGIPAVFIDLQNLQSK